MESREEWRKHCGLLKTPRSKDPIVEYVVRATMFEQEYLQKLWKQRGGPRWVARRGIKKNKFVANIRGLEHGPLLSVILTFVSLNGHLVCFIHDGMSETMDYGLLETWAMKNILPLRDGKNRYSHEACLFFRTARDLGIKP